MFERKVFVTFTIRVIQEHIKVATLCFLNLNSNCVDKYCTTLYSFFQVPENYAMATESFWFVWVVRVIVIISADWTDLSGHLIHISVRDLSAVTKWLFHILFGIGNTLLSSRAIILQKSFLSAIKTMPRVLFLPDHLEFFFQFFHKACQRNLEETSDPGAFRFIMQLKGLRTCYLHLPSGKELASFCYITIDNGPWIRRFKLLKSCFESVTTMA